MTLPDERYRAVAWAERFLRDLAHDRVNYPKLPLMVRQEAFSILRHFPREYEMREAAEKAPNIFQTEMEPLYRMVKQYEQDKKDGS